MNVSGILVVVSVTDVGSSVERLAALPGVDVHHIDEETGRIIVTQEAESVHDEVECLKTLKRLPGVILAEMVHHNFEDDRKVFDDIPTVPTMLRD
ncbi:MAG: chaperone NapD [Acidobacteriota bacterium]|nr:chaperone NapD [Acidobacteriota bacterium]MDH3783797.1 chaperone NapD [Acidobacteriota bacterium]